MSGLEGLLAGRLLGDRYRVEEVIGRGGMGAVYRATDERLGRQVALKVVTAGAGADAEARDRLRARFQREARAAAALPHHPNVVPVYDYGSDPTLGLDYIVMELLRGSDLATRLARAGPPPLAAAMRILHEAARGIAVGHRAGLIHRDVKPGNIFLAESSHQDVQVRVVDFGIAKLADDEDTASQLTQDGRVPHSPAFASPEQLRGLTNLTPASDVFSLGAVGFVLLTGRRPFSDEDRNRISLGMPVPVPSLRDQNPAIPSAVEAVIQRALAFDPRDRFADADEMAGALQDALRVIADVPIEPYAARGVGEPPADDESTRVMDAAADDRTLLAPEAAGAGAAAAATPEAPDEPTRAFPSRREPPRRSLGGMLVWALVLVVLALAGLWLWSESSRPSPEERNVEIPPPPDSVPQIGIETAVPETIGGDPELDALVLNQEGMLAFAAGNYASAAQSFETAAELDPEHPDFPYNLGLALLELDRPGDAEAALERALRLEPGRARAYYRLGQARLMLGDTAAAWASFQEAYERAETGAERNEALRQIRRIESAQGAEVVGDTDSAVVRTDTSTRTADRPRVPETSAVDSALRLLRVPRDSVDSTSVSG